MSQVLPLPLVPLREGLVPALALPAASCFPVKESDLGRPGGPVDNGVEPVLSNGFSSWGGDEALFF